jgi:hypothetical protein
LKTRKPVSTGWRFALQRDVDRVGMAAEISAGLEQGHLMLAAQQPGAGQTGNAGTDDGDTLFLFMACSLRLVLIGMP